MSMHNKFIITKDKEMLLNDLDDRYKATFMVYMVTVMPCYLQ